MTIRLAFDVSPASRPGGDRGLGRYSSWWHQGWTRAGNVELVELDYAVSQARIAELLESVSRQRALARARVDTLHVTSPLHLPVWKAHRWICSVQDFIAVDDPRYRKTGFKSVVALRQLNRADVVITSAHYTAERIVQLTKVDPEAIIVIPLPVGQTFFDAAPEASSGKEYVLAMADLRTPDPRKRSRWLPALEAALERVGLDLVVAGPTSTDESAVPVNRALGRVSDQSLATWMREAVAFVTLSQYEGQGLPPLEAMASGSPVVAFRNTATEEMVGVDDFLLDEPGLGEDGPFPGPVVDALVERVSVFRSEPRRYRELARNRAEAFRPERFFERVDALARTLDR